MEVPECVALARRLGLPEGAKPCPGCRGPPLPSYFREGRGLGCWVAHTALSAVEAADLAEELDPLLRRLGLRGLVLDAALLHDVGKLTEEYVERAYHYHNFASAVVAEDVLARMGVGEDRFVVASAVLLHHEARHWEELLREPLPGHVIETLRGGPFRLHRSARAALEALSGLLERAGLGSEVPRLVGGKEVYEVKREVKVKIARVAVPERVLPLYWVLYEADNRAASAREGRYWLWSLGEAGRRDPLRLAGEALGQGLLAGLTAVSVPLRRARGVMG